MANFGRVNSFSFAHAGLTEDQARGIWDSLKKAILEIQNGNASKLRFEELYRNSYTLVLHKHGDLLYDGVSACIRAKLVTVARTVHAANFDQLLETIVREWEQHKLIMTMIRDILMYMDKTYCTTTKKVKVYDLGLLLFRDNVVRAANVNSKLKQILLRNIANERNGEVIDRVLMKNCLSMLVDVNVNSLDVYQEDFERDFLQQTREFYQTESQVFISTNTCPDYLRKIEERMRQEENRAEAYLDKSSRQKLRLVIQQELVTKYAKRLVEDEKTGCVPMFKNNAVEDLARMYMLFAREKATLDFIRESMVALIKQIGLDIVKDEANLKDPNRFVQQVLDTRAKFDRLVQTAFRNDRDFVRSLKEALEYFINLDSRAAQFMSLFVDDMFRNSLRGGSDQEIDAKLNSVISIFRYLHDKDVFEDFYKQHLAQRLLTGQSINTDTEKIMIAKLTGECGHQFTSRLEGMFQDIERSKELMKGYRTYTAKDAKLASVEMDVRVLTTGIWPIPALPDCNLPREASQQCQHFTLYYSNLHSGRRLKWETSLGQAELTCKFQAGRKELVVHTYQMCILMLYNQAEKYTYAELLQLTKIPDEELQRHLLTLAHPKLQVLVKKPNVKQIEKNHLFFYNTKFTSPLRKVKVQLLPAAITASTNKKPEVPPSVLEARKNRVEAALVRVMKARKSLEHNLLIAEVAKQMTGRFAVDPSFIRKRIESLIEREYLARDKDNRRLYHYIA